MLCAADHLSFRISAARVPVQPRSAASERSTVRLVRLAARPDKRSASARGHSRRKGCTHRGRCSRTGQRLGGSTASQTAETAQTEGSVQARVAPRLSRVPGPRKKRIPPCSASPRPARLHCGCSERVVVREAKRELVLLPLVHLEEGGTKQEVLSHRGPCSLGASRPRSGRAAAGGAPSRLPRGWCRPS